MSVSSRWNEIEAILAEIEKLDAETAGQYRQISDRGALDICLRIERAMRAKKAAKV